MIFIGEAGGFEKKTGRILWVEDTIHYACVPKLKNVNFTNF